MIPKDKADIHVAMWHDFTANYREYITVLEDSEDGAVNVYKQAMKESIAYIIKHTQEFVYPTGICTYQENSPN